MIALGLAIGFRANVWNIGAEGQLIIGALAGGGVGARDLGPRPAAGSCRLMLRRRHPGRHGLGRDPGLPQGPLQRQRDPDQPDADLCRDAVPQHHWSTARGRTRRASTSRSRACSPTPAIVPIILEGTRLHLGVAAGACRRRRRLGADGARDHRLRDQGRRPGAGRRALRRLRAATRSSGSACCSAAAWPASPALSRSPARSASSSRCSRPATASPRSSWRSSAGCIRSASSRPGC